MIPRQAYRPYPQQHGFPQSVLHPASALMLHAILNRISSQSTSIPAAYRQSLVFQTHPLLRRP